MSGSIIQDEGHGVHLPTKGFGNDDVLNKCLEIDKALTLTTGSVDLAISNGKASKQMPCATAVISCFVQHRLARACWARQLHALACLNGGFSSRLTSQMPFCKSARAWP